MILIDEQDIYGFQHAIRGMRNSWNSWEKSDSFGNNIGPEDLRLMTKLSKAGPEHSKFLRFIIVYIDVMAPLYWWKQYDTYKVGTVANSTSTMHKLMSKKFTIDDFAFDDMVDGGIDSMEAVITELNHWRDVYFEVDDSDVETKKSMFNTVNKILPQSYMQLRTLCLNYQVLQNIYKQRRGHKLKEWTTFCDWIERLPYSDELITLKFPMCEGGD